MLKAKENTLFIPCTASLSGCLFADIHFFYLGSTEQLMFQSQNTEPNQTARPHSKNNDTIIL